MFLIMGISQKLKKLNYSQLEICKCCGKYGNVEVFLRYSYFMLFFIPLFKWDKRYFAKMSCCQSECEINKSLGEAIAKGEIKHIDLNRLNFNKHNNKTCSKCGFNTSEDFQFCPKCGQEL